MILKRDERLKNTLEIPEKVVFFKTIEKVQGQEADNLILSLTYGRSPDGIFNQRFGELNREYGECIFNVAVTRSKMKIFVIHSIKYEEISNPNIAFIAEYLHIAEQLSKMERINFYL